MENSQQFQIFLEIVQKPFYLQYSVTKVNISYVLDVHNIGFTISGVC